MPNFTETQKNNMLIFYQLYYNTVKDIVETFSPGKVEYKNIPEDFLENPEEGFQALHDNIEALSSQLYSVTYKLDSDNAFESSVNYYLSAMRFMADKSLEDKELDFYSVAAQDVLLKVDYKNLKTLYDENEQNKNVENEIDGSKRYGNNLPPAGFKEIMNICRIIIQTDKVPASSKTVKEWTENMSELDNLAEKDIEAYKKIFSGSAEEEMDIKGVKSALGDLKTYIDVYNKVKKLGFEPKFCGIMAEVSCKLSYANDDKKKESISKNDEQRKYNIANEAGKEILKLINVNGPLSEFDKFVIYEKFQKINNDKLSEVFGDENEVYKNEQLGYTYLEKAQDELSTMAKINSYAPKANTGIFEFSNEELDFVTNSKNVGAHTLNIKDKELFTAMPKSNAVDITNKTDAQKRAEEYKRYIENITPAKNNAIRDYFSFKGKDNKTNAEKLKEFDKLLYTKHRMGSHTDNIEIEQLRAAMNDLKKICGENFDKIGDTPEYWKKFTKALKTVKIKAEIYDEAKTNQYLERGKTEPGSKMGKERLRGCRGILETIEGLTYGLEGIDQKYAHEADKRVSNEREYFKSCNELKNAINEYDKNANSDRYNYNKDSSPEEKVRAICKGWVATAITKYSDFNYNPDNLEKSIKDNKTLIKNINEAVKGNDKLCDKVYDIVKEDKNLMQALAGKFRNYEDNNYQTYCGKEVIETFLTNSIKVYNFNKATEDVTKNVSDILRYEKIADLAGIKLKDDVKKQITAVKKENAKKENIKKEDIKKEDIKKEDNKELGNAGKQEPAKKAPVKNAPKGGIHN
ncbi:hypothetical protein SAMN02910369_02106 [Lachnospiraceae bacterium NE2001]|nr:hypothetical protein SAMN02910369_02106 [Lachnospiraceae bacterium NE2001]